MMSNTEVGNATINGSGAANTNFQLYIGEQNMPDPSNVVAASDANAIEGSNSYEKENCDMYFNFNDYLFQDLEPPGATFPDVYSSEFDQVNSDDQVAAIESVRFPGTTSFPDESST